MFGCTIVTKDALIYGQYQRTLTAFKNQEVVARISRRAGNVAKRMKVRITIETDQRLVIPKSNLIRFWCESCGKAVEFGTLAEVCALTWCNADIIRQLMATEKLHLVKASDGSPLICLQSVLNQI